MGKGYQGPLTKKGMLCYWGDELQAMPEWARMRHMEKGAIHIDGKDKCVVTHKDVVGRRLGVVSYRGDGKYADSTFHWFDNLPDSEDVATQEELAVVHPERKGWWPVIACDLHHDSQYYQSTSTTIPGPTVRVKGRILVICFYQLIGGRLVGWWVKIYLD